MEFQQLPQNATEADYRNSFDSLHACIEANHKVYNRSLSQIKGKITKTNQVVAKVAQSQAKMIEGLALDEDGKPRKRMAMMTQRDMLIKGAGLLSAVIGLWKFIDFSFPYVFHYLVDLNTAIHTGHF